MTVIRQPDFNIDWQLRVTRVSSGNSIPDSQTSITSKFTSVCNGRGLLIGSGGLDRPLMAHNRPPLYYTNGQLSLHSFHWAFCRPTLFCMQRGVGYLCQTTMFCIKRLNLKCNRNLVSNLRMQIAEKRNRISLIGYP